MHINITALNEHWVRMRGSRRYGDELLAMSGEEYGFRMPRGTRARALRTTHAQCAGYVATRTRGMLPPRRPRFRAEGTRER